MNITFNHVTTEVTKYKVELTPDRIKELVGLGLDVNNEDDHSAIREYALECDPEELSTTVVDGFYQDEEINHEQNVQG